jgi:hypothetical protein
MGIEGLRHGAGGQTGGNPAAVRRRVEILQKQRGWKENPSIPVLPGNYLP